MPTPRSTQISLHDAPYYHCVSRTVRRAFLCGVDSYSGQSFEHRRAWVEERLHLIAQAFSIDVAAYAIMSNHLHVVLKVDTEAIKSWSNIKVIKQWHRVYKGTLLTQKFAKGEPIESYERERLNNYIAKYRSRLVDISWFMSALNEPIARKANKEDKCTGHFWEGRFKSQALLDEAAVLSCMAYVDLNPIRAKMAGTPEQSHYTSIQLRINAAINGTQPKELLPFVGNERQSMPKGLTLEAKDYVTLVDDTGRLIRADKQGAIQAETANILKRLNIPLENWLKITSEFKYLFKDSVGNLEDLSRHCEYLDRLRMANACKVNNQHWQDGRRVQGQR